MRPLSVCFYCDEYPPAPYGGVGKYVQTVARALAAAGHRARVVGVYRRLGEAPEREVDHGVDVWRLRRPTPDKASVRSRALAYRTVAGWARQGEIDMIEGPDGAGWAALWPRLRAPLVTRVHGSITYFARELGRRASAFDRWVEGASLRRSDYWYACSQYVAERTQSAFELRPPDAVIYNPALDPETVETPTGYQASQRDDRLVVYAGTLTPKKGGLALMDAWPHVKQARPEARLAIYGKGDKAPLLNRLPEALHSSIEFLGHASQNELRHAFRTARAAVFPSFAEAFALAPMEAMAQCCPTIYSSLTSGPELIQPGRDGWLVDPRRTTELAAAIIDALTDSAAAQRLGEAGQRRILENYTTRQILPRIVEFYEQCRARFEHSRSRVAEPATAH